MATRVVMFREQPTYIPPYSPHLSTLSGYNSPSSTSSTSSNSSIMSSSISSSSVDTGMLSATKSGETLLFMRRIGEILRKQPDEAEARLTEWILDPASPGYWRPMIYSLKGCANEQMGRKECAKEDYSEGLRQFDKLSRKLGMDRVERLRKNAKFMEYRLKFLGGRTEWFVVNRDEKSLW